MKRTSLTLVPLLLVILSGAAFADFPVRQGSNKETSPAVAYNSSNNEYLAAWTEKTISH